ncbi:MAG: LptE family protein [bacterium]
MRLPKRAGAILWLGLFPLVFSCGYSGRALLPGHIKNLYVRTFENETTRYGVEQELTSAVTDAFVADGRLSVVAEPQADAMLRGTIVKYEKGPLTFDRAQTVNEFKIEIVVSIEFEDLREGKVLWKEDNFRAWKSYNEASADAGEDGALSAAVATVASDILSRTIEGW